MLASRLATLLLPIIISQAQDSSPDIAFSAGGGYDIYFRTIARHLGKHIPSNPAIIVENMTGAGSISHANFLYQQGKPNGLLIGNYAGGLFLQQIWAPRESAVTAQVRVQLGQIRHSTRTSAVELKMPQARWNPGAAKCPTVELQSGFALARVVAMRLKTSPSKHG
jgi:hypothetical protein